MLLRTLWLSLDPYMRGRMSDAPSYAKPVGIGEVMEGGTISDVVTSNVLRLCQGRYRRRPYWLADAMRCPMAPACKRSIPRAHQFRPHSASSGCRV